MIEESTDDQIVNCTRCAFSWIISQGFVNTALLYISCDFYLIIVWSILPKTEKTCFVKMLNSVALWFLTFLSTESEFSINAAAAAAAEAAR
jgi:hypothetical protein